MKKQNFRTAGFLSMAMLLFFLCGLFFAHPVSAENAAVPEASVSKEAAAAVKPQPKESLSAKIAADTRVIPEGSAFPLSGGYTEAVYSAAGFSAEESRRLAASNDPASRYTAFCALIYLEENNISDIRSADVQAKLLDQLPEVQQRYLEFLETCPEKAAVERQLAENRLLSIGRSTGEYRALIRRQALQQSGFDSEEDYLAYLASQEQTPEEAAALAAEDEQNQRQKLRELGLPDPSTVEPELP